MSYTDRTLVVGEIVAYHASLHWIIYTPAIAALGMGLLVCAGGPEMLRPGGWLVCLLALPIGLKAYLDVRTTEMAVTNRRVVVKQGWVSRRSVEILLAKIEAVEVAQSVPGRLLGHGTVLVTGTGSVKAAYPNIGDPLGFRRAIMEQVGRHAAPPPAAHSARARP